MIFRLLNSYLSRHRYVIVLRKGELMARAGNSEDLTTLQMALIGYEFERRKIDDKISELQARIKGVRTPSVNSGSRAMGQKRVLSAAARARIAAAQRKRWAEHRKRAAQAAKA